MKNSIYLYLILNTTLFSLLTFSIITVLNGGILLVAILSFGGIALASFIILLVELMEVDFDPEIIQRMKFKRMIFRFNINIFITTPLILLSSYIIDTYHLGYPYHIPGESYIQYCDRELAFTMIMIILIGISIFLIGWSTYDYDVHKEKMYKLKKELEKKNKKYRKY